MYVVFAKKRDAKLIQSVKVMEIIDKQRGINHIKIFIIKV
jgi:hypothetical protein